MVKAATSTPPPGTAVRWLWKSSVPVTAARATRAGPSGVAASVAKEHGGEVRVGHREALGSEILTLKSRTLPFLFHTM